MKTLPPLITGLVLAVATGAWGANYHTGNTLICSDCHSTHYSQAHNYDGSIFIFPALGGGGPFGYLLRGQGSDTCLGCHDGNMQAGDVYGTTDDACVRAAGALNRTGDSGTYDESHGHTIGSTVAPPGGTWTGNSANGLQCWDCHDPHGNSNYRNLHSDIGTSTGITVTVEEGSTYSGSAAVQQVALTPFTTKFDRSNILYRQTESGTNYGLSAWCAGCHENVHGLGGEAGMGGSPTGHSTTGNAWKQHPVRGVSMSQATTNGFIDAAFWFGTLASRLKMVSPSQTIPGTSGTSDNQLFCGTCHLAHGSEHVSGLVWDDDTSAADEDGTSVRQSCLQCHYRTNNVYTSSAHGNTSTGVLRIIGEAKGQCVHCHNQHASYQGFSRTTHDYLLPYSSERQLCGDASGAASCHANSSTNFPAQEAQRDGTGYMTTGRWPGLSTYDNSVHGTSSDVFLSGVDNPPGDCAHCHNPHGTTQTYDMLRDTHIGGGTGTANYQLCFDCHNTVNPPGFMSSASQYIKDYYTGPATATVAPGHQITGATGANYTGSLLNVGDTLPCQDCHNPHGSANGNGFAVSDQRTEWNGLTDPLGTAADNRAFCLGCHPPSDGVAFSKQVEGILMNVLTNTTAEHASANTTACNTCHGNSYTSNTAYNVHYVQR